MPITISSYVQGFVFGMALPLAYGILGKWVTPGERSALGALAYSGTYLGLALGMPLSRYLCDTWGVFSPFIAFGSLGVIWFILWLVLAFEKPSRDPLISRQEQKFIQDNLENKVPLSITAIRWDKVTTKIIKVNNAFKT